MSIGDSLGSVTVEMIDNGQDVPIPRVTCAPIGRITSGWFDRHTPYIEQEIEKAQARARFAVVRPPPPTAPRRRSAAR